MFVQLVLVQPFEPPFSAMLLLAPAGAGVRCGEKFHKRTIDESALAAAAAPAPTAAPTTADAVLFTTLAISEQLVSDAELRTAQRGGAMPPPVPQTRSGTVHVALNEAERCTGTTAVGLAGSALVTVADRAGVVREDDGGSGGVLSSAERPNVIGVEEGRRRTGGVGGVVVVRCSGLVVVVIAVPTVPLVVGLVVVVAVVLVLGLK